MTSVSGDDPKKIVEFPTAELPPEERARCLKIEVERWARLPTVEWLYYIESTDVAEKHGVSRAVPEEMVQATIRANEKKARQAKAEKRAAHTARREGQGYGPTRASARAGEAET